jgi:hypothetical protein
VIASTGEVAKVFISSNTDSPGGENVLPTPLTYTSQQSTKLMMGCTHLDVIDHDLTGEEETELGFVCDLEGGLKVPICRLGTY